MTPRLKKSLITAAWIIFFSAVVYFPIFLNLENMAVRIWDEARLTISAYEMNNNGDYIVVHFDGQPEMWSTKPPLMIWLQVFCIKILGFNELAVRLPSAMATLLICVAMFLFCYRFLKKPWLGMIAVGVLVTCEGFIREHVSRTGDYDALLSFFTTLYLLSFFIFTETKDAKPKNRFLLIFFVSLTLATMTKGVAAFIFLPAVFLYALISKQIVPALRSRNFYIGLLLFLVTVCGYYLWREHLNPGYFKMVAENELGGRYLKTIEGHQYGAWVYYDYMIDYGMKHWYLYVVPGLAFGLLMKEKLMRNFSGYILLCGLFFLLVISNGETQLLWYDAPVYPLIALSVAIFFWKFFEILNNSISIFSDLRYNVAPYIMIFLFFAMPYSDMISKVYLPKEFSWDSERYSMSYFLKDVVQGKKKTDVRLIVHDGYNAHLLFYIYQLQEKGIPIKLIGQGDLHPGDVAMAYQQSAKDYIAANYQEEVLDQQKEIVTYRIIGK